MNEEKKHQEESGQEGGEGRTTQQAPAPNETAADKSDISHVDQQEGSMHHGSLGGNFEQEKGVAPHPKQGQQVEEDSSGTTSETPEETTEKTGGNSTKDEHSHHSS